MKQPLLLLLYSTSLLLLTYCNHTDMEFSKSVTIFERDIYKKRMSTYVFYPSTLKMINQGNDSSYSELVKNIKKLKICKNNNERDTVRPEMIPLFIDHIKKEQYVELIQIQQNNQNIMIFMRREHHIPCEFMGIVHSENSLMIIDLLGNIPVSIFPLLLNGRMDLSGFNQVLNNKTIQPRHNEKHPGN
jgi:hypothetical protein